ncbi:hypothetical protein ACKRZS_006511 [Fusarium odoratissimum]
MSLRRMVGFWALALGTGSDATLVGKRAIQTQPIEIIDGSSTLYDTLTSTFLIRTDATYTATTPVYGHGEPNTTFNIPLMDSQGLSCGTVMVKSHVTILSSTDRIITAPETTTLPTEHPCDIVTVIVRLQGYKKGDTKAPLSQAPVLALSPSETESSTPSGTESSTVSQGGSAISSDPTASWTTATGQGTDSTAVSIIQTPSQDGSTTTSDPAVPWTTITSQGTGTDPITITQSPTSDRNGLV